MVFAIALLSALLFTPVALASLSVDYGWDPVPHIPYIDEPDESKSVIHKTTQQQLASYKTTYYFDQLVDHNDPKKGTFKQRYWHSYEFYEPGGAIILSTPGEVDASGFTAYLTNKTMNGAIAQAMNGSTIVLEHRFFGESNPYPDLSVKSLQVHTIQQAINDLEYFAKNVKLPMPNGDKVPPGKAPWILVGGSYSGALTAYTMHNKPDLFLAGYASSAVVQAIASFWGYFEPIRQNIPANCSADIEAVVNHIDSVLGTGDESAIHAMKSTFGLQDIVYVDDFAAAMKYVFNWYQNDYKTFAHFCEALEVDNGQVTPKEGWGLNHTMKAWGKYWNETFYPMVCGTRNAETCLGGSHNPHLSHWNNVKAPNAGRAWKWLQCNEFGFFSAGAPQDHPSLVSRFLTIERSERSCDYDFPGAFHGTKRKSILNALGVNTAYDGWATTTERLIFTNGLRDPWREATVGADNVNQAPQALQHRALHDGGHCADLFVSHSDPHMEAVQQSSLEAMRGWFKAWKPTA